MFKLGDKATGWCLAVFAALVVFSANFTVIGPMIQADEGSYLANAAAIAGFQNDMAGSYSAGYSLLIAPAFWLAKTSKSIWLWVKIINSTLYFAFFVSLWFAAKSIRPESSTGHRLGAVIVVALYPMWVIMAGYSFAQIAFVPFFMLVFLVFTRLHTGDWRYWSILGVVAGFLYWIHPTAVAVIISLIVAGGYIAFVHRKFIQFAVFLFALGGMMVFYKYGFKPWLYGRMTISGSPPALDYPSLSSILAPLESLQGIEEVAVRLCGHVFYLIMGTVGLIGTGLISISQDALTAKDSQKRHRRIATSMFLWISIILTIGLSVLLFSSTPEAQRLDPWLYGRLDHWMYGRYVEGVIAPVLLVGALRLSYRVSLWTLPVFLICAIIFWLNLGEYKNIVNCNVPAFWQQFKMYEEGVLFWAVTGLLLILIAALIPRRMGIVFIGCVFAYSAYLQIDWHDRGAKAADGLWRTALKVRESYPPGTCVGFDHSGINSSSRKRYWYGFGFVLFDYGFQRMSFDKWIADCDGPLFSYERNLNERKQGIYAAAASPDGGPVLWVKGKAPFTKPYPMSVKNRSDSLLLAMGSGWHSLERSHVWSSRAAELTLPVPDHCRDGRCSAVLNLSAYGASSGRPVRLFVKNETGGMFTEGIVFKDSKPLSVRIPLEANSSVQKIYLSIPEAISPKELEGAGDARVLGAALREITLEGSADANLTLSYSAANLLALPRAVGRVKSVVVSDGRAGYLIYGPYRALGAGKYKLVLTGKSKNHGSAWVDVVSDKGKVQHAKFQLKSTSNTSVILAEGQVELVLPVQDIEVRVYVGDEDDVILEGYELVPMQQ